MSRLRTSLAPLRQGRLGRRRSDHLAELPLRVVPADEDSYEVLDGFQRLERWAGAGATQVPVVVEHDRSLVECKRALLAANAPRRTLSAMDEARVVYSLRHDDGLGPKTIARLLGRKPVWVERRLALASGLAPDVIRHLDQAA